VEHYGAKRAEVHRRRSKSAKIMKRSFIVTSVVVLFVDGLLLLAFGAESTSGTILFWIINLPALPLVYLLANVIPPPMGESGTTPWDTGMVIFAVACSAIAWGLIALAVATVVKRRKQTTTSNQVPHTIAGKPGSA
jgi:hypothetical protein